VIFAGAPARFPARWLRITSPPGERGRRFIKAGCGWLDYELNPAARISAWSRDLGQPRSSSMALKGTDLTKTTGGTGGTFKSGKARSCLRLRPPLQELLDAGERAADSHVVFRVSPRCLLVLFQPSGGPVQERSRISVALKEEQTWRLAPNLGGVTPYSVQRFPTILKKVYVVLSAHS